MIEETTSSLEGDSPVPHFEEVLPRYCFPQSADEEMNQLFETLSLAAVTVMGQMATDGGHSTLEALATLSVLSLTKQMFTKIEWCHGTSFEQLLLELMFKTGRKEKQIAKNKNYHEGLPTIT